MARDPASPRLLYPDADADSRTPRNLVHDEAAIFDDEWSRYEVELVLGDRDPERTRQVAWSSA